MDNYDRHMKQTQKILDEKFKQGDIKQMYMNEVFEGLSEIPSFGERVKTLRNNSQISLNTILQYTFRNDRSRVTKEMLDSLDYQVNTDEDDISIYTGSLSEVAKRLYILYRDDLKDEKIKSLVEDMLNNLHPIEQEILIGVFKGKIPYKNVTKKLVEEAFPDLFAPEGAEEAAPDQKLKE